MEKENKQPKRKNTVGKYVAFVLAFFLLSSALVYMHHNQIIDLSFLFSQSSSTSSKKPVIKQNGGKRCQLPAKIFSGNGNISFFHSYLFSLPGKDHIDR